MSEGDPVVATTHGTVLLIGASRGLGLALAAEYIARGSRVVATVRSDARTPLHDVQDGSVGRLEIEHVDIAEPSQVSALHDRLAGRTFDLLFVNAGVTNEPEQTSADVPVDVFNRLMVTNALSPLKVIEALDDVVTSDGTIAVMSSGQGSVANNERGGFEVYRASKSALNQLMRSYAARHRRSHRTLLLMAPGWVQTDLGGPHARLAVDESIPRVVSVVDAQRGHGGLQFLDYRGETVPW